MKPELQDILQQSGVKGMKWGKVQAHVDSIKREHSWNKALKNAKNMSTKEIGKHAARAQLENDLKRLSKKSEIGSSKDKQDYLNRAKMGDQELFRKVQRLRAKENLNRTANDATRNQKEMAMKVVKIAAPLAIQYALTKSIDKKDIFNAVTNPNGAKAKVIKSLMDKATKAKHSDELEDILQHHGIKGMRWGAHKRVLKMVKDHRAKQNKRVLEVHNKLHPKNNTYKKLYEHNSNRYKTHLAAARKTQSQIKEIQRGKVQLAVGAGLLATPHLAPHVAKAANAISKAAQNPDNIRKAKNIVQTLKRSPIRYVDGKAMKNVIN